MRRLAALSAAALVVGTGTASYAVGAWHQDRGTAAVRPSTAPLSSPPTGPRLVFRHTGKDDRFGLVAEVPLSDPRGGRYFTKISCDRIDVRPTGASCLRTHAGTRTTYDQVDYDPQWHVESLQGLPGPPSRTRLSPDGTLAASTSFVTAHSYMTTGFSTATEIHEVDGRTFGNLESFALTIDGRRTSPVDRNIWGVTFMDDRHFFATVETGGTTYLARGDLQARTLTTMATAVECPSLSPDGTRIAFKQKVDHDAGTWWTPAILDLATGRRTVLSGETHNVDDQIAWLDDDTLMYAVPRAAEPAITDVWSLDAKPEAKPALLIPEAWSPAVVR